MNINERIVETGEVILTNMHLFNKWSYNDHQKGRYSSTIIINKQDKETLDALKKAIRFALAEGKEKVFGGEIPERSELTLPLKYGDDISMSNILYSNSIYLNASSFYQPRVVGKSDNEVYPYHLPNAMYGTAKLLLQPYNIKNEGRKGVSCMLLRVKLLRDVDMDEILNL